MLPKDRIDDIYDEYNKLKTRVSDVSEMNDQRAYKKLSRRFNDLQAIVSLYEEIQKNSAEINETKLLIQHEKDLDLISMAKEELINLQEKEAKLLEDIKELLAPKDPRDSCRCRWRRSSFICSRSIQNVFTICRVEGMEEKYYLFQLHRYWRF